MVEFSLTLKGKNLQLAPPDFSFLKSPNQRAKAIKARKILYPERKQRKAVDFDTKFLNKDIPISI